jgi:hypothetical protein
MWAVKIIAIGCMSSQMVHEDKHGRPFLMKGVPPSMKMERGGDDCEEQNDIPTVHAIAEDVCKG